MKNDHLRLIRPEWGKWQSIQDKFQWDIPEHFNIAEAVCDSHARSSGKSIAIYHENNNGVKRQLTFSELRKTANQLANALSYYGVGKGDRVGIILPQRIETVISHIGVYKIGAITVPLSILFGPDAVNYRLNDSGAKIVITDAEHTEMLESMRDELPNLELVINCDADSVNGFWLQLKRASDEFQSVLTRADDPAYLVYTSGTTGPPKGALAPHRCLIGNLPGFEMSHNFFPQKNDLFWTPADWAWTGGLMDALIPSLYYGVPVLGYDGSKFDPDKACNLMERYRVKNSFIPPTALKMLRQADSVSKHDVALRSIMSAGEALGSELFHWGKEVFGIEINEMWAQTEFNYICGNCTEVLEVRPGSVGKSYPGHRVEAVDGDGMVLKPGQVGELVADRDDPVMVSGYWNNESATKEKYIDRWWSTGDSGYKDEDGYIWFVGRKDDVISSAGYRIGPGEIEDCLLKHPAIAQVAVIGVPDQLRGEAIKAFIVLKSDCQPSGRLTEEIQDSVRSQLAAYEYPRHIEYIDELPLTTTGKVKRNELRTRPI